MNIQTKKEDKYKDIKMKWKKEHPEYNKQWSKDNKDKVKEYRKKFYDSHTEDSLKTRFNRLKKNALNRGIVFDIDIEYLSSLSMKCAYTGIALTLERNKFNTVSYDRVDNNKGYIVGNVTPCCVTVNEMKRKMTKEELVDWCIKIVNHNTEPKE